MNIMLIITGAIIFLSTVLGYRKGFIKLALTIVVMLFGTFIVFAISPRVSSWIQTSTPLTKQVRGKVESMLVQGNENSGLLNSAEASREQQIKLIEEGDMPDVLRERLLLNNNSEVYELLGVTSFLDYIGAYISKILADIIAFLITAIIVLVLVRVLLGMAGVLNKLPVVGRLNKLAGGVLGTGVGVVSVWILFIVVTLLYNTTVGQTCLENIASDATLTKLYNGNILMNYIVKF